MLQLCSLNNSHAVIFGVIVIFLKKKMSMRMIASCIVLDVQIVFRSESVKKKKNVTFTHVSTQKVVKEFHQNILFYTFINKYMYLKQVLHGQGKTKDAISQLWERDWPLSNITSMCQGLRTSQSSVQRDTTFQQQRANSHS